VAVLDVGLAVVAITLLFLIYTVIEHSKHATQSPPIPSTQEHVLAALRAARELGEGDLEALAATLYVPVSQSIGTNSRCQSGKPTGECEYCTYRSIYRMQQNSEPMNIPGIEVCFFHMNRVRAKTQWWNSEWTIEKLDRSS